MTELGQIAAFDPSWSSGPPSGVSGPWDPLQTSVHGMYNSLSHVSGWNLVPQAIPLPSPCPPPAVGRVPVYRWSNAGPHEPAVLLQADDVRTIYVSGLPLDLKEREFVNLLRFLPGFETCQITFRSGGTPLGFGLFASASAAKAAVRCLDGVRFDAKHALHAQLARTNMSLPPLMGRQESGAQAPAPAQEQRPCNTLYIGNLGHGTQEAELHELYGHRPGFQRLRMVRTAGNKASAFIVFADTASAIRAKQVTSGAELLSSDRGPLRVHFSKNPSTSLKRASPTAQGSQNENRSPTRQRLSGDDTSASS